MLTLTLTLLLGCRVERCDGVDNDGDGLVDDDDPGVTGLKWHEDLDGDTFGNPATERRQCRQPGGYVADDTDCDDGDEGVRPNVDEVCDGVDNDCDGLVDDADPSVDETGMERWYADADGDGSGDCAAVYACAQPAGTVPGNTVVWCDCDDANPDVNEGTDEVCDGIDNDCDALIDDDDDGLTVDLWYPDEDRDGYGAESHYPASCDPWPDAVTESGDCDDEDPAVHPGTPEICNDVDDDCNGLVDGEDPYLRDAPTWYADGDRDGYGNGGTGDSACHAPRGTVADATDCDDADAAANPGATEVCDDLDNDCDGLTDGQDDSLSGGGAYYLDLDGDGFGDPATSSQFCSAPSGYVGEDTDRDDTDATSGSCPYPPDCAGVLIRDPDAVSGRQPIDPDEDGVPIAVQCDMDSDGGGWTVLADEDYASDPCPAAWTLDSTELLCAGASTTGVPVSATWSAYGITWSEIQVTIVARQYASTDAFSTVSTDIEDNYVDGVSVTHGASGSREHLWSYAVAQSSGSGRPEDCPDDGGVSPPAFAGSDWSCTTGNPASSGWSSVWYADELFNALEQVTAAAPTTDDVEVRILANQGAVDEDVGVVRVYIAVR